MKEFYEIATLASGQGSWLLCSACREHGAHASASAVLVGVERVSVVFEIVGAQVLDLGARRPMDLLGRDLFSPKTCGEWAELHCVLDTLRAE